MPTTATESCLEHNARYARGEGLHVATHPGLQPSARRGGWRWWPAWTPGWMSRTCSASRPVMPT
jgi:hypothetical protein